MPVKEKEYIIAILDDDADDLDLLSAAFTENHDSVRIWRFGNAPDLFDLLYSAAPLPALLITDHFMPFVSGMDVITTLRTDARTQNLPIVLLSTIVSPPIEKQLTNIDNVLYMKKPSNLLDYTILSDVIMEKVIT